MCSIVGALLRRKDGLLPEDDTHLYRVWERSVARGRDGRGFVALRTKRNGDPDMNNQRSTLRREVVDMRPYIEFNDTALALVGNFRAEPTTEYVMEKREADQQPYSCGGWHVVHNGTIANDKELRTYELDTKIDSAAIVEVLKDEPATFEGFTNGVRKLKGSFAILAVHSANPDRMFVACNYRPIWYIKTEAGFLFGSSRDVFPGVFPGGYVPVMVKPYTITEFHASDVIQQIKLHPQKVNVKRTTALVVCSGGLDSVVSAAAMKRQGYDIHLLHFGYGSRAQGPEFTAAERVAAWLNAKFTYQAIPIYQKGDSPLLDPDAKVAGGEAGAEFAHEWVPARNTVLLALAVAFAEARGYEVIALGNNLEEAGAYPDNEPEFIARWNDLLPFAVGDGKRMRIEMPVGNLMKHEIVALGHAVDAPMHLTWSCYRAGAQHCGTCGPCFMRRTAFKINNLPEVIGYEK